ncbi:HPr kinase/phosphorylase [Candidatus Brocadiaceae bacterium]|nr:HPr kinase/phosphorylase [Candidatus Brocadiaceae bacterium]
MITDVNVRIYSLYGLAIAVRWEGREIGDEIDRFFSLFPFSQIDNGGKPAYIELKFVATDVSLHIPYTTSKPLKGYDSSIYEADGHVYLTDGLSIFQLDPQAGTGLVTLHSSFKEKPPLSKYNFFLIGLIHLLAPLGIYDLHAAALMRDGIGYLFLGESGSGKSSTALSLVRQGWHYVSDDALLVRPSADGIEVLAFRKHFYLDPVLAHKFPEIAPHLKGSAMGDHTKRFLDIDAVYPGRFLPVCIPGVLIYTQIVPQPESTLIPIDKTTAFIRLMRQSASLFFKRQAVNVHLEAMKRLVSQSYSYELLAGRDLYERPERISDFLLDNIKACNSSSPSH